jgi:Flp pilus assembly protein TadG
MEAHMNTSRQRPPKRQGMALIWVALAGMVFVVFLGLAADTARVYMARHQLQNAADAAALAGVYRVRNDPLGNGEPAAHDAAMRTASNNNVGGGAAVGGGTVQLAANLANAANGDIVIGVYDFGSDSFSPGLASANAVQVTARRTAGSPGGSLPLLFAPVIQLFGGGQAGTASNVSRTATAVIGGPSIQAGLILLNRDDPNTLDLRGTGSVDPRILVTGGGVQVNSDNPNGINWAGSPTIDASGLFIGSNQPGAAALVPNGVVSPNAPPVPDPLGGLPPPTKPGPPQGNTSSTLNPGYYTKNDFPKGGNGTITLTQGIYWIDGGIDSGRDIDATAGVLLYFNTGSIVMRGNAALTIAPMDSGTYAGIAMYQARGNTATATIRGSETQASSGVFYFPSAQVVMWGTPMSACTQLIADKLDMRGTGQLTINYNGGNPILGHKIWLVR